MTRYAMLLVLDRIYHTECNIIYVLCYDLLEEEKKGHSSRTACSVSSSSSGIYCRSGSISRTALLSNPS